MVCQPFNLSQSTLVAQGNVTLYRLISIGSAINLTDSPYAIKHDGITYWPSGLGEVDSQTSAEGSKISNSTIRGMLSSRLTQADVLASKGKPFQACLAIQPNNGLEPQFALLAKGRVGIVQIVGGTKFEIELLSNLSAGDQVSNETISPSCVLQLGSDRCGLALDPYRLTGTIDTVLDSKGIFQITHAPRPTIPDLYFMGGACQVLQPSAADNDGIIYDATSLDSDLTEVQLVSPLAVDLKIGMQVNLWPGCNKMLSTCRDKFRNTNNFKGAAALPTLAKRLAGV